MFERITLGFGGDVNLISTRLYNHPECVFPISVNKSEAKESVTYINFEPADNVFMLDQYVNVIAEYIIERYESGMLRRILEEDFSDLSVVQKREILRSKEAFSDDETVGYQARKQSVILSVYDFLREESTMLIEGFVAFRLKEYEGLLCQLAERMVEKYIAHKEYEEFIALLKYFVNIQRERPEMIHVLVQNEGGYVILDEKEVDITARCFADFLDGEILLTEEAYDDLLISVLITLAPKNITVHNRKVIENHELFSTIAQVFEGKITYCDGCLLCQ